MQHGERDGWMGWGQMDCEDLKNRIRKKEKNNQIDRDDGK